MWVKRSCALLKSQVQLRIGKKYTAHPHHVVAKGVNDDACSDVPGPDEDVGRVDPEHGGVGELEEGDDERRLDRLSVGPDPLDHVVKVGDPEQSWRKQHRRTGAVPAKQDREHAGSKSTENTLNIK